MEKESRGSQPSEPEVEPQPSPTQPCDPGKVPWVGCDCISSSSSSFLCVVHLEKEDGQQRRLWMSSLKTIAEVLQDFTPEDLKKANPVIVVDGSVCRNNLMLGTIAPTDGRPLHLKIRRSLNDCISALSSSILAVCVEQDGNSEDHWMSRSTTIHDLCRKFTPAGSEITSQQIVIASRVAAADITLGELALINGEPLHMTIRQPLPTNIIKVRLRHPRGLCKNVLMTKATTIKAVLKDYTPEHMKNACPVIFVDGICAMPDMSLGEFFKGDMLNLTFEGPPVL